MVDCNRALALGSRRQMDQSRPKFQSSKSRFCHKKRLATLRADRGTYLVVDDIVDDTFLETQSSCRGDIQHCDSQEKIT